MAKKGPRILMAKRMKYTDIKIRAMGSGTAVKLLTSSLGMVGQKGDTEALGEVLEKIGGFASFGDRFFTGKCVTRVGAFRRVGEVPYTQIHIIKGVKFGAGH